MKARPPLQGLLRNVFARVAFFYLLAIFAYAVGWPTFSLIIRRDQLITAIEHSDHVRLEAFDGEDNAVLASCVLSRDQALAAVRSAMPLCVDVGDPSFIAWCFDPHHRIVVVNRDGATCYQVQVCFSCEQYELTSAKLTATPYAWRQPLRELFEQHAIPVPQGKP